MQHERFQSVHNGRRLEAERVEIEDTIVVETQPSDASTPDASGQREYEVVGIVEDGDSSERYAVCYSDAADEFIIIDDMGKLLKDHALAQEILTDFLREPAEATEEDDA